MVVLSCLLASLAASADVHEATLQSACLGRPVSYTLALPPVDDATDAQLPVLYLLHGLEEDHTTWVRHTAVAEYAARTGMLVVTPGVGDTWYVNSLSQPEQRVQDMIVSELIPHIDAAYPTLAAREGRAIDGVSMGGHGAMVIGFKHPELFCSVGSLSGILQWARDESDEVSAYIGPPGSETRRDNDPFWLLKRLHEAGEPLPRIQFSVGEQDHHGLVSMSISMMYFCRDHLRIPHIYRHAPGEHDYDFWDGMLWMHMQEHARAMGLEE